MKEEKIKKAYRAGKDVNINGSNTVNCSFTHFATPQQTKAWEFGEKGRDYSLDLILREAL